MTRKEKIKRIRSMTGFKTKLSWAELCQLTNFDSFMTCFSFGYNWEENCPNDRIVTMSDSYLNMIIFNLTCFPKAREES